VNITHTGSNPVLTINGKKMKQTAVQWLFNELWDKPKDKFEWHALLDKALAMEKGQSISDYCEGFRASGEGWNGEYGLENGLDVAGEIGAEDYFNRTYGGDK